MIYEICSSYSSGHKLDEDYIINSVIVCSHDDSSLPRWRGFLSQQGCLVFGFSCVFFTSDKCTRTVGAVS